MAGTTRTVDLIAKSFDLNQRRKYELVFEGTKIVDLYFKPITRADRKRAMNLAGSEDALLISTQMLVQLAELEDGTKAFHKADAPNLQRELPEKVLNDLELFMFDIKLNIDQAKNELSGITG